MTTAAEELPAVALSALSTLSCSVSPGFGGLGRHFEELIELTRALRGGDFEYRCPQPDAADVAAGLARPVTAVLGGGRFLLFTPLRWNYAWTTYAAGRTFDVAVARSINGRRDGLMGFSGQSLASFRRARAAGYAALGLLSPTCHVDHVMAQQRVAMAQYPVDKGWINSATRRRALREYDLADVIFVSSQHQRATFLAGGVPDTKLVTVPLASHPRFRRREAVPSGATFEIAYVGRFDLAKGLPVLLDAFRAAAEPSWRLTLQGEFCTRRIRRYLQQRVAGDARIQLVPAGDPLPVLQRSHVFVHPSYDDGFGYGPIEAMAVGVPVIVTDQTGMKERITEGVDGFVVPAGDVDALAEQLRAVASGVGATS
ncbi:MAG TPA: glycosyltransferase family 4 protein [Mycobacteriales bacterium]|nr:glycosyltransferase family 4 protein [Mycobacteriales bacterium]